MGVLSILTNRLRIRILAVALLGTAYVSSAQSYFLNGNAQATGNGCYAVTPNLAWQVSTIWCAQTLDLSQPFSLEFDMNFGTFNDNGADGMVFVMHTLGTNAIGPGGGSMGFESFNPSFGIEFDTFMNSPPNAGNNSDPAADHIAFLRNGNVNHASADNLAGPIQANAGDTNIEDGLDHHVRIVWDPSGQVIQCYFDCVLRLTAQVILINGIFGGNNTVTWGFTGSTGGLFNLQTVCLSDYILDVQSPEPICVGQSVQLAAAGPVDVNYTWTPATGLDNPSIQNPVASPTETTTYTVSYTNVCGEVFSEEETVMINFPPVLTAPSDITLCPNATGTLLADTPPGSIAQWTTTNGTIEGASNLNTLTVSSAGEYNLMVTSAEGCLSFTSAFATQINQPNWFIPDAEYSICEDEAITLTADAGDFTLEWNPGALTDLTFSTNDPGNYDLDYFSEGCTESYSFVINEVILNANDLGLDQPICETETVVLNAGVNVNWSTGVTASTISVNQSGTYSYSFSIGACSTSDEMTLLVDALPQFELTAPIGICPGDTIVLSIPFSGQWSNGTIGNSINVTAPGNYGVSVSSGQCVATDGIVIAPYYQPAADLGEDIVYCVDDNVAITALNPVNDGYLWNTGETSPNIPVSEPGLYTVQVSNSCGAATDSVYVSFEECTIFVYIPNAFTPDGDGINDLWKPVVFNLDGYEVWIYDRWGTELFHTADPYRYWQGNVRGGEHYVPAGAYLYRFAYAKSTIEIEEIRGTVVVVR